MLRTHVVDGGVAPGHELIDMAVEVAGDEALEDVDQIGVGVHAVELAGLDERGDDGLVLGPAVGAGEEGILAIQGDRPDRPLDHIGVELDAAVVEEADQPVPVPEGIADGLGEAGLARKAGKLGLEPGPELLDEGSRARLPGGVPLLLAGPADLGLDGVELGNLPQGFLGDRRVPGLGDLVEPAAAVRPAVGERRAPSRVR